MRKAGTAIVFALLLGAATGAAVVKLSHTSDLTLAEINSLVHEDLTADQLDILTAALARHSTAAIIGLERIKSRAPRSAVELLKLLDRLKLHAPTDHR